MIINGINWTDDDIKTVEKFIEIKNKGYYVDGKQLTDIYNRLLGKHVNPTNCGSCLRQRTNELEGALNHARELERQAEEKKQQEMKDKMAKVREARKKKEEE
jgi:hypothetical protein